MSKVGPGDPLARLHARQKATHPLAETRQPGSLWRVHGHGHTTIGWIVYRTNDRAPYALYYDGTDAGIQAWCRSFDGLDGAVAFAVQHAAEMRERARTLGPSRVI